MMLTTLESCIPILKYLKHTSCLELSAGAEVLNQPWKVDHDWLMVDHQPWSHVKTPFGIYGNNVKYLLHENYGNITRYHGLTDDESGKSIDKIVRIIEMKLESKEEEAEEFF